MSFPIEWIAAAVIIFWLARVLWRQHWTNKGLYDDYKKGRVR